jgi:hypothetical protein
MGFVPEDPTVVRIEGVAGPAWVVACPATGDCIVVDWHHAPEAIGDAVAARVLRIVGSLGTRSFPPPPPRAPGGEAILAGLLDEVDPLWEPRITVGPVPGWAGALVARVGDELMELSGDDDPVVFGAPSAEPFRLRAARVVVPFGELAAIGAPDEAVPAGTLAWRVGTLTFHAEPVGGPRRSVSPETAPRLRH